MSHEFYNSVESELNFYKQLLNKLPASVHILEVNDNYETMLRWATDNYVNFTGISLNERAELGFANPYDYYHPDDAESVIKGTRYIIEGQGEEASFFCRMLNEYQSGWVFIKIKPFKTVDSRKFIICLAFPTKDENKFASHKFDTYVQEIARLKNQIKINKLSKTECHVFKLLAQGLSTKEVATKLNRSFNTINNHRRSIFNKLGIHKISEAVALAKECGI